jgi:hypothetical protein
MAPEQNKTKPGGNRPKPQNSPAGAGQSAKDRSRAQNRAVSPKAPTGKAGRAKSPPSGSSSGRGGNRPRPPGPGRPAPAAPKRPGISAAMMAWGAVGLVIVIVAVLVIVKLTSTSTDTSFTPTTPAPASVVQEVTNIPASVYNTVGVSSSAVPVTKPTVLSNQPPMTLAGKSPAMLYYGAEYCPYCAAERWAMTAALSRFGTWSGLKVTASSHTDVNPGTNTFSYHGATLTSPYITFSGIEQYSNVPSSTAVNGFPTLQNPTAEERAVIAKYSSSQYNPYATTAGSVTFPFVDINNVAIISSASFSPGILAGQTWSQIAGGLSDPTNPATQAIVTTANYISAAICASSKGAPASVCQSPGVQAAIKALNLKLG